MKRLILAALAVSLTSVGAGPAHAAQLDGLTCGMLTTGDPFTEAGVVQTGVVFGGPVRADGLSASITVRCSVLVNASGTHNATADAFAEGSGTGVAVAIQPVPISFVWSGSINVYLCTRWTVNGTHHYYDEPSGTFSTTASAANCALAASQELPGVPPLLPPSTTHLVVPDSASANTL